jgi:hypothetical protein
LTTIGLSIEATSLRFSKPVGTWALAVDLAPTAFGFSIPKTALGEHAGKV